jgi:hypothetical protein
MFTGRVIHGPDTFKGQVMTRNLVSPQLQATLNQMASGIGKDIGAKIADRLQHYSTAKRAPKAEPVKFKDGTPLASDLTTAEAEALGKNLHLVGAYVNDIDNQRYFGVTLEAFAEDRIYNGPDKESVEVTADLWNAIQKQSAAFSAHYER